MSRYRYPRARILVFAREPVPGRVKTRLQPALGEDGTVRLYKTLLETVVGQLEELELAPWELWVTSNPSHEYFLTLCNKRDIYIQSGNDLGARMDHASSTALAREAVDRVIIIGSDCPVLDADYLSQALAALAEEQVVIGPADDGGYVLIGMNRPQPALFQEIDWGTASVLHQTQARLEAAGLTVACLEQRWDVDRPGDLERLKALSPEMLTLLETLRDQRDS